VAVWFLFVLASLSPRAVAEDGQPPFSTLTQEITSSRYAAIPPFRFVDALQIFVYINCVSTPRGFFHSRLPPIWIARTMFTHAAARYYVGFRKGQTRSGAVSRIARAEAPFPGCPAAGFDAAERR
jgi:hypothetical protein